MLALFLGTVESDGEWQKKVEFQKYFVFILGKNSIFLSGINERQFAGKVIHLPRPVQGCGLRENRKEEHTETTISKKKKQPSCKLHFKEMRNLHVATKTEQSSS